MDELDTAYSRTKAPDPQAMVVLSRFSDSRLEKALAEILHQGSIAPSKICSLEPEGCMIRGIM